jgi:hypothetical protein
MSTEKKVGFCTLCRSRCGNVVADGRRTNDEVAASLPKSDANQILSVVFWLR